MNLIHARMLFPRSMFHRLYTILETSWLAEIPSHKTDNANDKIVKPLSSQGFGLKRLVVF